MYPRWDLMRAGTLTPASARVNGRPWHVQRGCSRSISPTRLPCNSFSKRRVSVRGGWPRGFATSTD